MPMFRKKPVAIEAMQWDGTRESAIRVSMWTGSPLYGGEEIITIDTLEGTMRAAPGDWIIKGVKGEFYPCKPDIFAATYELARATAPGEGKP